MARYNRPAATTGAEQGSQGEHAVAQADAPKAKQLVGHLKESGTPTGRLRVLEAWVKDHQEASAEDLYRWMDSENLPTGTLRKAGKFIFGTEFEPEKLVQMAPADELLRLRQENDQLQARNAALSAEKLGLTQANQYLRDDNEVLTRKVAFLTHGKSKEELAAVGM